MRGELNRHIAVFSVGLVWLVLDQLTKASIRSSLAVGEGFSVIDGCFNIVHVLNRGAAFGFLNSEETNWQFWLFGAAAIVVGGMIVHLVRTSPHSRALFFGLGSILGGAAGNLIDRIFRRAVTDFMDVYWGQWHWPAFNVADVAICLGVFFAGIILLRQDSEENRRT
ncbi:MAG: signal peptidase II [Mailhella sp.]